MGRKKYDALDEKRMVHKARTRNLSRYKNPHLDDLRYHFARWCWPRQTRKAPSGVTWDQVFQRHWGMTLLEYSEYIKRNPLEKKSTRSTESDPYLP